MSKTILNTNWDLIQKTDELSVQEYRQLYDQLVYDPTYVIPWEEPLIFGWLGGMIDRVRLGSKSSKKSMFYCTQQFKYGRILNIRSKYLPLDRLQVSGRIGNNVHMIINKVWDHLDVEKIKSFRYYEEISDYIYNNCYSLIPDYAIVIDLYEYYFRQYSDCAAYRIMEIINNVGMSANINKYIIPTYRECPLFNADTNDKGIVDQISLHYDDSYIITDWKTGKVKYYFLYSNDDDEEIEPTIWEKRDIAYEISEYYNLLQGEVYIYNIKTGKLELFDAPLVDYGRLIYLKDWMQTYEPVYIDIDVLQVGYDLQSKIVDTINSGKFTRRTTINCINYCEFFHICKNHEEWVNKFSEQEKLFHEAFKYFSDSYST